MLDRDPSTPAASAQDEGGGRILRFASKGAFIRGTYRPRTGAWPRRARGPLGEADSGAPHAPIERVRIPGSSQVLQTPSGCAPIEKVRIPGPSQVLQTPSTYAPIERVRMTWTMAGPTMMAI